MINVIVADDSFELNSLYCNYLAKDKDIKIISRTYDGEETLKDYLMYKPDVLLLDLDMPKMSGNDVINKLSELTEEKNKCNIIVISAHKDMRLELQDVSKIYKIFTKPCQFDGLLDSVKEIGTKKNELSDKMIKDLLLKLGINLYYKGTPILIEALKIAYNNPELLFNMSDLYRILEFKLKLPKEKIQRRIRGTIDTMNNHLSRTLLCSFFHIQSNETISPKYFFEIVIEYFNEIK